LASLASRFGEPGLLRLPGCNEDEEEEEEEG